MDILQIEAFRLELSAQRLWQGEEEVRLTTKAFAVLRYLVEHREQLVSRDDLFEAVWGTLYVSEAALAACIRELRRALGDNAQQPTFIQTVRGRGYRFVAAVTPAAPPVPLTPATALDPPQMEASGVPQTLVAERRQLTVLFCDLVDSTRLAVQLDPEDLREVLQVYHQTCAEVVERFDGYVAQYLGDGVLVYVGYPVAHEDAARRAIHMGLGIIDAVADLNARLACEHGIRLAVRIGIHTGLVVVGHEGERADRLAIGATPNLAAHLQGLAAPNTVVISADTHGLTQGFFDVEALGAHDLKGISQPTAVYRVLGDSGLHSRFDVAFTRGLTPLVGREQEVGLLLERWERARDGQGQVILLSGEAGIGKSRLVQVLKDHVAEEPYAQWECHSSPYYQHTALYPIMDLIQRILQWQIDETPAEKLKKLENVLSPYRLSLSEAIPLLAPLLSLPIPDDRYPPLNFSPQRQRQKTLESIVAILLAVAEQQPVLFILEDLHWTDPTTLEFLGLLVEQVPTAAIYILSTCRPHFQPPWHHRSYLTEITVNRLSRHQIEQMVTHLAGGKMLPTDITEQLVDKTDGVPLYVEEMTKDLLESGQLQEMDGGYELTGALSSLAIPATLQDSLMARLDRLATAKAVAQYGAVMGRQFSYTLLQAVSQLDETMLQHELSRLVEAELLYQRGRPPCARYIFTHALIQDVAYASLLRSTRQQVHQQIAQQLEVQFPKTVEMQPELVAYHYTEAGRNEQAVVYWRRAGHQAVQHSANVEAIAHITKGLALLTQLPETLERAQDELALHIDLGVALTVTKGFAAPEVEHAYARARALCQQLGDTPQLFPVLYGLWNFYLVRSDTPTVSALAEQIWALAQRGDDAVILMEAHNVQGQTRFMRGDIASARGHIEQVLALYDPQQHSGLALEYGEDPGIACSVFAAWDIWHLGYPDSALQRVSSMRDLAQELAHPFSTAQVLFFGAGVYQLLRDGTVVQAWAARLMDLCRDQDFMLWLAGSLILHGWALSAQGQHAEGIGQMQQGLEDWRATGAEIFYPWYLGLLAEAYGYAGQPEVAWSLLDEALTAVSRRREGWCEAELYRAKGELLGGQGRTWDQARGHGQRFDDAEQCLHQALSISRHQQAKSWELRAATSLARLWQQQGKCPEAYDLLAPVYDWFTEGFDTADLQDAAGLMEELQQ